VTAHFEVRDWLIGYTDHPVAGPFDARWESGGLHLIRGENGSGKSTLGRTIAGLLPPCGGRIVSRSPGPTRFVPQDFGAAALASLRTDQVVASGGWEGGRESGGGSKEVRSALDDVGLLEFATTRFGRLSGGQARRALIARSIVASPTFLVLDEPTAGLDRASIDQVAERIEALAADRERLIWVVTHQGDWLRGPLRSITAIADGVVELEPVGSPTT